MHYDKGDRLIFTQNGEQRSRGEWSFTFPDAFGRVVLEGTCSVSLNYNNNPLTETVVNAIRTNATDANKGYTISGISVTNMQIHRVNYYDNYTFIGQNSVPTTLSYTTPDTGYGTRYENHYKGLLTGSIIARWENGAVSGYDYAAYYYDQQGRVVQEKRTNHLGGLETYQHAYDRLGNPLKKKHVHTASGKTTRTEELAYTYDHAARPTKVTHKLNSGSTVTLAEYTYDEFGRMATKIVNEDVGGSKTFYSYNIHGWLVDIHHPYMRLEMSYNNDSIGFNGNITKLICSLPYGLSQNYSFTYDGLNRMLNADYSEGYSMNQNLDRYTEKVTEYDKNGNIKKLQRYGQTGSSTYGLVDNLTYTYNGNQLTRVDDATTATSYTGGTNFINGANTNNEYTYDQNGNLTKDLNKNISNIQYNLLNLPSVVTFSDGSTIRYMYSADGTKLRTTHVINGTTTTTDYCGNVIYENGTAKKLLTDGGYVDLTTTTPTYYYYVTDHQGNNRAVISASGSSVLETNHYYPFGGLFSTSTNAQPYKYNGKELDTKKGLNLYDYGARHYDAALGRFTTFDPLSEKDYLNVPYGYCGNNPIIRIDRDGKAWDTIWDLGNLLYDVVAAIYNHIQGDHAQAQSHWKDAGADALATAAPFIPAGVTKLKYADDVVDAAKATNKVDNAADAANKFKIVIPDKDKIDRNLLNPPTKPGKAPTFKSDGTPVEIHHVNQNPNGPFIEMNIKEHRGKGVDKINHPQKGDATNIDRNEFNKAKKEYWKNEYQDYFNQQHRK